MQLFRKRNSRPFVPTLLQNLTSSNLIRECHKVDWAPSGSLRQPTQWKHPKSVRIMSLAFTSIISLKLSIPKLFDALFIDPVL